MSHRKFLIYGVTVAVALVLGSLTWSLRHRTNSDPSKLQLSLEGPFEWNSRIPITSSEATFVTAREVRFVKRTGAGRIIVGYDFAGPVSENRMIDVFIRLRKRDESIVTFPANSAGDTRRLKGELVLGLKASEHAFASYLVQDDALSDVTAITIEFTDSKNRLPRKA